MIYSRQYSRQFIVLKSMDLSKANGRCVIEVKNSTARLIVNTYNLQPESIYDVFFVMKGHSRKAVKIGDLVTDHQKSFSFLPDDIEGYKIEDAAAVVITKSGDKMPVLAGFTDEYIDLKSGISIAVKTPAPQTKIKAAAVEKNRYDNDNKANYTASENTAEKKNNDDTSPKKRNIPYNIDFIEMFNKFRRDMEELEHITFNTELPECECEKCKEQRDFEKNAQNIDADSSDVSETLKETVSEENNESQSSCTANNTTPQTTNYIEYIKSARESIQPFENKTGKIQWYKINPSDLASIEDLPIGIMLSPFVIFSYLEHKYIILGVYEENGKEKYIVGIPCMGSDEPSEKYFKQFIPCGREKEEGYRLFYI